MLTLAMVDAAYAGDGTNVTLLWGEEDGGTTQHISMIVSWLIPSGARDRKKVSNVSLPSSRR